MKAPKDTWEDALYMARDAAVIVGMVAATIALLILELRE